MIVPIQHHQLTTHYAMSAGQLEKFAHFLETHPGFYPELMGENAVVCGFRVGGCLLSVGEMNEFISTEPHFAAHEAALLLAAQPICTDGGFAFTGKTSPLGAEFQG
jgi:hypothetical protein